MPSTSPGLPETADSATGDASPAPQAATRRAPMWLRLLLWLAGLAAAGTLAGVLLLAVVVVRAWPQLPDVSALADYQPKLPLRVFSAEGALIGEFGEERRTFTPLAEIPQVMQDAVLAIEDARFYEHGGVDYVGMARALLANLGQIKSQGASTITMQVARNVYLSSEKTYTRKFYEILLTYKLEQQLTKQQILEIYMNQIFLGQRAYGFAAASEAYYGKPLKDITIAEAAMLAGLPKAPATYNPVVNPQRARVRQRYIIDRMVFHGFISAQQAQDALAEELYVRRQRAPRPQGEARHINITGVGVHAEFAAEMARQLVYAQYGAQTYTRGLNVYTSISAGDQDVAYKALRRGIMDYERRQRYRGPEHFITLPEAGDARDEAISEVLERYPDNGDVLSAVVLSADTKKITVQRADGQTIDITGAGLKPVESGLSAKAAPNVRLRPGAVIRIVQTGKTWAATQLPEVEGAFVAMDPHTGAIRALVGGFDFAKNKFNHVTQAWRQPGSTFKPFIYSAALERGITPATLINDAPVVYDTRVTGGRLWEPKNYDGKFEGPLTLRSALAKSRNVPSVLVLESITPAFGQSWITRFGFEADRHPPFLTLALGAGHVTPMQVTAGMAVFANGGYRVDPWLIARITDQKGQPLYEHQDVPLDESRRAIPARNAFTMNSMLQTVARSGTAARAQGTLKRPDLFGKTGTTNDSKDAWFTGFHPSLVATVWVGYDTPRKLGSRETGGGVSLPVWIDYMRHALDEVPQVSYPVPQGLARSGDEWIYRENLNGSITDLGMQNLPDSIAAPTQEEHNSILDLFRN